MQPDGILMMADNLVRIVVVQGVQAAVWLVLALPVVYWHAWLVRRR